MALPTVFANLTTSPSPLALFDTTFNAVAAMGTTRCTATGTNTIALTQNANQTTLSAYANYLAFSFVALNTTTGAVTVNVNTIGARTLYLQDAVTQATSGNIVAGVYYEIVYNSALNSGAGGFQIISGNTSAVPALTAFSNSLGSDVALSNTSDYFDGPFVAQGTIGKWFASGTISLLDTNGPAVFYAKLWDANTVIASGVGQSTSATGLVSISLSGILNNPLSSLRISAIDISSAGGKMLANQTGADMDSTLSAFRIG